MEKISEMIKRMCPEGVERVKLSSIVNSIHTGLNPRSNFKLNEEGATKYYVTVKEITSNKIVFSSSTDRITDEAWNIIQNRSHLEKGDVLFSGIGTIGKVVFVNQPVEDWNCSESVFVIKPKTERINGCYLAYILRSNDVVSQYEACAAGSIMKGVRKATLESLEIPLPPLPIQQEIVRILDSFTLLHSNLEAELVSRQKQYEFYRNKLLTFDKDDESVEWKTLGEISIDIFSGATPSTKIKEYWDGGTIPWMSSGEVHQGQVTNIEGRITELGYSKCSTKLVPINSVVIALAGQGKTRGTVAITRMSLCTNQSLAAIVPNTEIVNPDYLYFYLKGEYMNLRTVSSGDGTRGGLNLRMINEYNVPIVSIQRQQEIVSTLDTFESLITNLKKEIEARKKQYEYYREQLLTFE